MKKAVEFPVFFTVGDYHEIDLLADQLNEIFKCSTIKPYEIGLNEDGNYVGMLYVGRLPSQKNIKKFLKKNEIVLWEDEV